jgi:hypothetical protein
MSLPVSSNGTKVYIADAVTSEPANAAAYAGLTWVEIGDVESLGDYGDEAPILTAQTLQDERVFKAKGARDAGTLVVTCLDKPDDAGQIAAIAAEATKYNYPIKVVLPNRLTIAGTDEVEYFIGLVTSKRKTVGDNSSFIRRMFNIAINSKITTVAAT